EVDDVVDLAANLPPRHAEHGAVEIDVLTTRQLRAEAGSDLEQAAHSAANDGLPLRRRRDAREDLQQRGLARAVLADDAEHFALLDRERDVLQSPDLPPRRLVLPAKQALRAVGERVAKRLVRVLERPDLVLLRKTLRLDGDDG